MDATTTAVTTGLVVTVGRWTQGKGLEANVVIGAGVFAIGLSAISNSQPEFASKVGMLVLVSALLIYTVPITKSLGFQSINKVTTGTTGTRPTGTTRGTVPTR